MGLLLTVSLIGFATPPAAAAGDAVTGDATFVGTATLPQFPCLQTSPCAGSFEGDFTGHLSGVVGANAFSVEWQTTVLGIGALFTYYEAACLGPDNGAVLGLARGSGIGTASSSHAEVVGVWTGSSSGLLPRLIRNIWFDFEFEWVRTGNTAALILYPASLSIDVDGIGWIEVLRGPQRGVATFVPTHASTPPTGTPSCTNPITDVEGEISGNVPLTWPSA